MKFNDSDRKELWITVTTNVDPASATLWVTLDGTEYSCTWDAAATQPTATSWTRAGHTNAAFAGPAVAVGEVATATVLALGYHSVEVVLRVGGRILAQAIAGLTVSTS